MGSRAVGAAVRRRSRDAHPAGSHPRHRRRARLRALGIEPAVWHLNEGHAAFVALQRIRELIEQGRSFDDALEEVRRSTVFTTHTPVPAGHDAFPFHLVEKHLAGCWGEIGAAPTAVPRARRIRQRQRLAVQHDGARAAHRRRINGVSALHGTSRERCGSRCGPTGRRTACRSQPSPTACTCRPGWPSTVFALLDTALRARLARPRRRAGVLGAPRRHSRRRDLWRMRAGAPHRRSSASSASACVSDGRQEHVGPSRDRAPPAPCSIPNALTHRLRAAVHRLQAPGADLPRSGSAGAILNAPDRPVQIVFAGKAHPGRRARQAPPAARVQARARSEVRRTRGVHRRLRHARRASTWCRAATSG